MNRRVGLLLIAVLALVLALWLGPLRPAGSADSAGVQAAAPAAGPAGAGSPSFAGDIVPVLKRNCLACHVSGQEAGQLALAPNAAYASLVGVTAKGAPLRLVDPGRPESSYLLMKIKGTQIAHGGAGTRMPQGGEPLDAASTKLIEKWIENGAPDN